MTHCLHTVWKRQYFICGAKKDIDLLSISSILKALSDQLEKEIIVTDTNKRFTVSLSRAHKLSERLTRHIDKLRSDILGLTRYVQAQVAPQADKAAANSKLMSSKFAEMERMAASLTAIRESISVANEDNRIHSMLSAYKAEHRLLLNMQCILDNAESFSNGVSIEDAKSLLSGDEVRTINVQTVDHAMLASLEEKVKERQRTVDKLGDEINNLNAATRITLELSQDVADVVGL